MNIPTTNNYLFITKKANEQNMRFKNVLFRKASFLVLWVSTLCMPALGLAQVSGTVFRDFNANGAKDNTSSYNEVGIGGITINAYNSVGTLLATQTSSTTPATLGQYSFPASGANSIASGTAVRLEFTGFAAGDYPADKANSFVQFVTAPITNINMGVNNPEDYVGDTNPYVASPQYVNGTYNNSGSSAFTGLYTFRYEMDSNATGGLNYYYQDNPPNTKATVGTMGATWGVAYQRSTKTLYASAVLRRFCGFGPLGTGGIYKVDMTNPSATTGASNFIDVKTIGIPTGNDVRTTSGCNAISTDPMAPANDIASADNIGKVGIGGIEYDENRNILWLVNLNDRKLYGIKNISPSATPTSADVVGGISIDLPSGYSVVNGLLRPWGVKVHRGYIYVGAVADGSGESNIWDLTNLKGYILKLDLNNMAAGFTVEYEFSFDYNRGNYGPTSGLEKWACWQVDGFNAQSSWYTQPIISDMEFDTDGSIIVGVLDRGGLQNGNENYGHVACTNTLTTISARGDVLRLCKTAGGYVMSGNSGCTTTIPSTNLIDSDGDPAAPNNYIQEYYWGEHGPVDDNTGFNETALGALAILPGSSQVMATVMDPENFHSGGVLSLNNTTGAKDNVYNLYYSDNAWGATGATMAKAIGLGDIEILANTPNIEIGNRVWHDTNKNGIQDAGEAGIAGVTIQLSKYISGSYTAIATCTTDANGNYYFSSASGTSATGITYNVSGLTPNSQFKLYLPTTYNNLMLTAPNIVSGSNSDEIDSDADGYGTISFTTGNAGENKHSYDIGFQTPIEICTGEEYTLSVPSGTVGQWYKDGAPIPGATGITYVVTSAGNYNFIGTDPSGCTFTSCTNAAFITGNCARVGNYVWNDTNGDGLNNEVASAGINGVHIQLYKVNGGGSYTLVDSTITANNNGNPGYYQFIVHTFGDYLVRFIAPTGKNLTKTNQAANTDNNSDADGIGVSGVINLVAGTNDSTIDAGFVNSCTVGNILYLCGSVKPADADAFDHGMIQYLQGLGNTITPALTQNTAGLGLYNPMTMVSLGLTNLNGFDAVIVSPTVEGSYSPTLVDSLKKSRLPILASDYWVAADLGLSSNTGFDFQTDVHDGTSQVPFYNYTTFNPIPTYGNGVFWADYNSNATPYLWLDATAHTNGNKGVYFVYEPTDVIINPATSLPLNNHGRRVFYGIHANGIYENTTNGGAIPSPASAWLNPYTHLTSYGKRYLDSALALICTTKAPAGSIGNFVWNDTDGDGTQDVGETGINGVKVKLYQDNGSGVYNLIDSTTTATNGAYSFTGLGSWNYYVQFPTTTGASIPLTVQTTTAATDGNSDASSSTGNSPIFAINASGTGTAKDNPTIDAGYYVCTLSAVAPLNINTIDYGPQTAPQPETVTLNAGGNLLPESNVAGFYHSSTSEGALYTFCAEISQPILPLQNPYTHEPTGSTNGFTAAQAYRVAQVVQAAGFNSQTGLGAGNNTVTNLVALQLACWNAIYDTDYSVTAGNFQSTTSNNVGAVTLANTWLTAAQAITTPTSVVHKLHHASGQDLFETGDVPPITVQVTPPTCSGAGAPNNATMTVVGFSAGQRYQYSTGTTFNSAAATPVSPTAIPVGGVVVNNLANTTQSYTIRIYDATNDACFADRTVTINSVICVGSVGNYVWTDTNGDGSQDVGETGINGVTVELYKETAPSSGSYALVQTTTTANNGANDGAYNFVITESANYYVHFPTTTSGKTLSSATTTTATDGNSDANISTGNSPVFAINVNGIGTAKDNPTIDAGYKLIPIITAVAGSCDPSANQYNVTGTITGTFPATGQMLVNIAGEGSILYGAPFASSPISYNITGLISDGASKTVTVTFTDAPGLNTSVNYTAPTACITHSCVSGGGGSETHTYTLPLTTTDVVNQAVTLPKFDDMGGTRILEKVLVTQKQSTISAGLLENTSAGIDSFFVQLSTKGLLSMASDTLLFSDYNADYKNELPANVLVPTNGAYPSWLGDINQPIGAGFVSSTLARIETSSTAITNDLANFIDPRLNSGWVTNLTGNATHDDDIWYINPLEMSRSSSKLLTTSLSNYIGTGNLNMTANADAGFALQGGGGNIVFYLRTKYKTEVTVTYYYCPAAKVGNYVWTDTDGDGTQDAGETGINGLTVELYKETAPSSGNYTLAQTTTTANDGSNDGAYNFTVNESANYYVHFPTTSGVNILTTQTTTAATDGNSDADFTTGNSPIFAMDVNGTGIAQNNPTIDAGYTPINSTVGDYVWLDSDKDGQQDANEKGVSGVTVSLINNANEIVATMQTDAYGYYLFHNVAVGNYTIRFSLPIAYAFTIQEASPTATGSDANGSGYTNTFTVNAGDNITDIDAGIYYEKVFRGGLGNFVWLDANTNGRQDAGELGVANVAVMLYNTSGTLLQATLTNSAGYYQFLDLPAANYVVGVRLPLGYQFVGANLGGNDNLDSDILPSTGKTATIILPANTFDQSNDAGIVAIPNTQASIGDYVWNDANHNGLQESDEVGVSNVTVELWDDQNSLIRTTRTDAYGYYMFTDVTPGFYSVKFELPAGWAFSTADVGADNDIDSDVITPIGGTDTIRVAEGDRITNIDAGVYNPAATVKGIIGDYVWYDLDKDGTQDATEAGVPGVMVTLYDGSNFVIAQTTTNENGKYLFIDLPVGTYSVGFSNIREGYTFTTSGQGGNTTKDSDVITADGKTAQITLTSNAINLDLDAGIYPINRGGSYASLGDRVWYDVDNDGLQDAQEVGAPNVTVRLYDATNTQIAITTTDANGRYLFGRLNAGTYTVNFTLPADYSFSPQKQGSNDNTDSDVNVSGTTAPITLMASENNTKVDAGLYKSTGTASIGDYVWNDANNDGIQTPGERGVGGVSVTLYNAAGIMITTTVTDKNGYYLFPYMNAGSYSVGFNNFPTGFSLVAPSQGGDTSTDSDPNVVTGRTAVFTLTNGQAKTDIDAGLNAPRAALGDYVWNDSNANGLQDGAEEGVPGITVHLFNSSNQYISSAVTDASGYYLFYNLTSGNYYVNVSDLPIYTAFTRQDAGDDIIDSDINPATALSQTVTLVANDFNRTVDAGLNLNANAALEGYVWFDANGDGLQDVTEVPVPGVLVTLESLAGFILSRTVSGSDGMYHFENVVEGTYRVRFSNIPVGSRFTTADVNGSNSEGLDSDANPSTGLSTSTYSITSGQRLHAADAGLLPPSSIAGTAFEDAGTTPNGLQDPTEITFSNILVMLYTSADSVLVGTTLTDKKGNYLFTGLYPDNYFVVFDAIAGRAFTAKDIDANVTDDIDSDVNFFGGTDVIALGVGQNIIDIDAGYLPAGFIFPVTMAYFTVELVNTDGLLKWKTTAEVNTSHFEIYRSLDEFSYEKIGNNVDATGEPTTSTSYNTFDYNVNKLNVDRVFYRLKIVDEDGSFNWSNVVALNLTHTDQTIFAQVYPNPAETTIWIDYQLFDGETADLKITNSVGQAVYIQTIKAKDSLQQLSVDISKWADGVYYLNIQSENGNFVRKIIKE